MFLSRPSWKVENLVYLPVILALAAGGFYWYLHSSLPVHELFSSEITPNVVRPDAEGKLCATMVTVSRREEKCDVTIERTFARVDNNVVVLKLMLKGGIVQPTGRKDKGPPNFICFPPELFPDGDYIASTRADNKCYGGRIVTAITDIAYFRIERPK
jgi:hypothetical protein